MESNNPAELTSSLAKVLHYFCNGFVEFMTHAHLTGILCLATEDGQCVRFSVDEKVLKLGNNCVKISSHSFNINIYEESNLDSSSFNRETIEASNGVPDQYKPSSDNFTTETILKQVDFIETFKNDERVYSTEQIYNEKSLDILQRAGSCSANNEASKTNHFDVKEENSPNEFKDFKIFFDESDLKTEIQDLSFDSSDDKLIGAPVHKNNMKIIQKDVEMHQEEKEEQNKSRSGLPTGSEQLANIPTASTQLQLRSPTCSRPEIPHPHHSMIDSALGSPQGRRDSHVGGVTASGPGSPAGSGPASPVSNLVSPVHNDALDSPGSHVCIEGVMSDEGNNMDLADSDNKMNIPLAQLCPATSKTPTTTEAPSTSKGPTSTEQPTPVPTESTKGQKADFGNDEADESDMSKEEDISDEEIAPSKKHKPKRKKAMQISDDKDENIEDKVVNNEEKEIDNAEGSDQEEEKKRKHNREQSDEDDQLDDEDFELIYDNLGIKVNRKTWQIQVPTDDSEVITNLRQIGEPICLLNERPVERIERLRRLLGELVKSAIKKKTEEKQRELKKQREKKLIKTKKKRERSDQDAQLDDEDFELIYDNLGIKINRKHKYKRIKMLQDDDDSDYDDHESDKDVDDSDRDDYDNDFIDDDSDADGYTCSSCNKVFSYPDLLMKHLRRSHQYTRDQALDLVKKVFYSPLESFVKNTNREMFLDISSNKCEVCGKEFKSKSSLNIHHVVHTGEKKFECKICGKKFTRNSNMKQHTRIHYYYTCEMCGRNFSTKADCEKHQITHT